MLKIDIYNSHVLNSKMNRITDYMEVLEKPVGTNLEQLHEIIQAAKKSNRILEIGYVLRYAPFYAKLKELVASKAIGEPLFVQALEQSGKARQNMKNFFHEVLRNITMPTKKV